VVRESQGKRKSDWKVGEILGFTFLYSCCNANNSRAGVQSTILLAVVVWLLCLTVTYLARRKDYTTVTISSIFPLKFVAHRWVENVPIIERVIDILPKLKEYMRCVDAKKVKNPGTKSFEMVRSVCRDSLHFILSVALPRMRMHSWRLLHEL